MLRTPVSRYFAASSAREAWKLMPRVRASEIGDTRQCASDLRTMAVHHRGQLSSSQIRDQTVQYHRRSEEDVPGTGRSTRRDVSKRRG